MRYFGKEVEVVKKRKLEYVTCDCCKKKILVGEKYFDLFYVNDDEYNHSTSREDICPNCIIKYMEDTINEMYAECELGITAKTFGKYSYEEYDICGDKLIEEETDNDKS